MDKTFSTYADVDIPHLETAAVLEQCKLLLKAYKLNCNEPHSDVCNTIYDQLDMIAPKVTVEILDGLSAQHSSSDLIPHLLIFFGSKDTNVQFNILNLLKNVEWNRWQHVFEVVKEDNDPHRINAILDRGIRIPPAQKPAFSLILLAIQSHVRGGALVQSELEEAWLSIYNNLDVHIVCVF